MNENNTHAKKHFKVDFLQLNCHKMPAVMNELDAVVANCQSFILGIQEPNFQKSKPERLTALGNYDRFHARNTSATKNVVRTAIVASKVLNLQLLSDFTGRDMTTVVGNLGGTKKMVIASVYWDQKTDSIPTMLSKLPKYCKNKNYHLILLLDSNSHSEAWYSNTTDDRGLELQELFAEHDLWVINNSEKPSFVGKQAKAGTNIDVTAVSAELTEKLVQWHYSNEVTLSDHRLIRFKLGHPIERTYNTPWAFSKSNWSLFENLMQGSSSKWQ